MTVDTTIQRQYFDGDGLNKNFPFNFKFFDNSTIYVSTIDSDGDVTGLTEGINYTLTGAGSKSGGKVVMISAPGVGFQIMIERILPEIQTTSFRNQGAFFPAIHEDAFDKLVMLIQQAIANIGNALNTDRSGRFWDFKGKRGINAADPVNGQDVVTKNWVGLYLDKVTGVINTTLGISYDGGTLFDYLRFGVVRSVDSTAALRLLSGSRNLRARRTGYYTKGDGGFGDFYVDTTDIVSADDGFSVIVGVDGSRWKLVHDGRVNVLQGGLVGDGVTANVDRLQAMIDAGINHIDVNQPVSSYRLEKPIRISRGLTISGYSCEPYAPGGLRYDSPHVRGKGSWFFLDHTGRGFDVHSDVAGGHVSGVFINKIGTIRPHVLTPTTINIVECDSDIYVNNADCTLDDILFLNPYRATILTNGGAGRLTCNNLRGQPLFRGHVIDESYDACHTNNVHWWTFWTLDQRVLDYQLAYMQAFVSSRNDNPFYSNLFSIFHNVGFLVTQKTGVGTTSKLKIVNADLDRCANGFQVSSDVVGASGKIFGLTSQGELGHPAAAGGFGAAIGGTNCEFSFHGCDFQAFPRNLIRVTGTGNNIKLVDQSGARYNQRGETWPAIEAVAGNVIRLTDQPNIVKQGAVPLLAGPVGTINAPAVSGSYTGTTDANGLALVDITADAAPSQVLVTPSSDISLRWSVVGRTATQIGVRFWKVGDAVAASQVISFDFTFKQ